MPIFSKSKLVGSNQTRNSYTHEIVAADFNGDGKLDVASGFFFYPLSQNAQYLSLLVGNGRGSFAKGKNLFTNFFPTTVHPRNFLIAEFNGDGKPDLFIADHGYDTHPFPGAQNQLVLSTASNRLINATENLPHLVTTHIPLQRRMSMVTAIMIFLSET